MRIRTECIGLKFNVTAPNGVNIDVTIENNTDRFELYKLLKLDVFDNTPVFKAKVVERVSEIPKAKVKNASNKGN